MLPEDEEAKVMMAVKRSVWTIFVFSWQGSCKLKKTESSTALAAASEEYYKIPVPSASLSQKQRASRQS